MLQSVILFLSIIAKPGVWHVAPTVVAWTRVLMRRRWLLDVLMEARRASTAGTNGGYEKLWQLQAAMCSVWIGIMNRRCLQGGAVQVYSQVT